MSGAAAGTRPFWLDRPVLVTGATGFAGSWLVRRLHELGADVVCLVRDRVPQSELVRSGLVDRVRTVAGDVCDQALLERTLGEYEIATVLHLAAQTIVPVANRNPLSTFESNIKGTWTVLEACRRSPTVTGVVTASSDKAYGDAGSRYSEDTPLRGEHPYDVSKSCSDLISRAYSVTYGLRVAVTRCGNFYGGGDLNWNRLVPGTIRSVLRGSRPLIRSDGRHVRDYLYVEDAADAYVLLAESLAARPELSGTAFNFSYELELTVLDMARRILALMGSDLEPDVRDEASNEIRYQSLRAGRARDVLGWRPRHSLDEGIVRAVAWYRDFLADWDRRQPTRASTLAAASAALG